MLPGLIRQLGALIEGWATQTAVLAKLRLGLWQPGVKCTLNAKLLHIVQTLRSKKNNRYCCGFQLN